MPLLPKDLEALKNKDRFFVLERDDGSKTLIDDADTTAIVEALDRNVDLKIISLSKIEISTGNLRRIAEALRRNSTLTKFSIHHSDLDSDKVQILADVLRINQAIKEFSLFGCGIGTTATQVFAEALRTNRGLTDLELYDCKIGPAGAQAIAAALDGNNIIEVLNIGNNGIGDDGAKAIAVFLRKNRSLIELNLGINDIRTEGVIDIFSALTQNDTLSSLVISGARPDKTGVKAIKEYLENNEVLLELVINVFLIGPDGLEAVAQAISKNNTLQKLAWHTGLIPGEVNPIQAWVHALRENQTLVNVHIPTTPKREAREKEEEQIEWALKDSKNILTSPTHKLDEVCRENKKAANKLVGQILDNAEHLAVSDIEAIKERLPAVLHSGKYKENFATSLQTAQSRARELGVDLPLPRVWQKKVDSVKPIPRSSNPLPLKVDRALTQIKLEERKPDGRSNLLIFAEQGQLADVFTADIWQGRREEMDKTWELVPLKYRNQVDIELVRGQLDALGARARFRRGDGQMDVGF